MYVACHYVCADSTWGRFFRSAELEKMVDQDLSRLYPEHGSYFQTPGCQGMLRRILLLWCLRHPEHGYRQGKLLLSKQSLLSTVVSRFETHLYMRKICIVGLVLVTSLNNAWKYLTIRRPYIPYLWYSIDKKIIHEDVLTYKSLSVPFWDL